jgi:alkanesulfonate monooxygenase SsuD/methylene tetrahydromethanopterin reductase-like flavin-dependent oxidoreductase (luciferase family)
MVQLGRLTAMTHRLEIGVSAIALPLYQPAVIAKQLLDLDVLSGGRVRLGIGIGGEHPEEFRAVNVPISERGARTNESLELIRKFWPGDEVTHHGRFYNVDNVRLLTRQPPVHRSPPIIVAGRKSAAMRRAVAFGDGWFPYLYSPERYQRSVEEIRRYADEAGRDLAGFDWCVLLFIRIGTDAGEARQMLASQLGQGFQSGQDFGPLIDRVAVAGTLKDVIEKIQKFIDAGARHIHFSFHGDRRLEQAEQLIEEVLPRVGVR